LRIFRDIEAFTAVAGEQIGVSAWHTVDQEAVDLFARASGDFQWIHTDPERAAAGPFGRTIAHGYLTLALVPTLLDTVYTVSGLALRVNYGADTLRFTAPVPVGARIRAAAALEGTEPRGDGVLARLRCEVEVDGSSRPACVVTFLALLIPEKADDDEPTPRTHVGSADATSTERKENA
jgi:acyl dehydratase